MSACLAYVGLGGCAWLGDKTYEILVNPRASLYVLLSSIRWTRWMCMAWGILEHHCMSSCLAYVGLGGCAWLGDKTKKRK